MQLQDLGVRKTALELGTTSIISFFSANRGDGYQRCAYVMIDKDVAYASPSTVYRVLREAGMLQKKADDTSRGKGFKQPLKPHEHRRTDISYVKIEHRFYFFICVLDGYSRYIVHWDLRENMKEMMWPLSSKLL